MAKDISLLGADYPDVPAVTLPQTGGGTATFIEESELGNTRVWVGTCDTAAATRDKAVTITGVTEYKTGDIFVITFANAQDYNGAPRLNVNSLGVKTIRRVTGTSATRYQWQAGETLIMVYDGTYMVAVNQGLAGTTYFGLTKLQSSCTSTSSGLALTASALNAYSERMIAGAALYSADSTYEVGDKVRSGWYIYECSTPITEAEEWNAEHWTQLPALQTQIDTLSGKITTDWGNASSWCTSIESGATTTWQKFGSVRTISFRGASRSHTEDEVLMTIPEGHRPLSDMYFTGFLANVPVVIAIKASTGNVTLYLMNGAGSGRIMFSITYIAFE